MADLEFFFDPGCPFAWVTSRWVVEVQSKRDYTVDWRFISLKLLNEHRTDSHYTPEYRAIHLACHRSLRVCDQVRLELGNEAVFRAYTAFGEAFHLRQERQRMIDDPVTLARSILEGAGLPASAAEAALDDSHDARLAAETHLALERTGRDVGTPILTFRPGATDEGSFFGPVISKAPRGAEALRLWDAVEVLATTPGLSELKRTKRAPLDFT